jgi:hydroxymethylpyrimidine pyrophosphatase-like HAD family hydrolase
MTMAENLGWVSIHRKIQEHWVWQDDKAFKIWVGFLMKANHADNKIFFDGQLYEIKRGSFVTSLKKLAHEFKCSIGKIRRILILFQFEHMIELNTDTKKTHVTIVNYNSYQNERHTESTQKAYQKHTESTQTETNNNDNNVNNDNKERESSLTLVETTDQIDKIWRMSWSRNPKLPEREETEKLVKQFGYDKTLEIMKKAVNRNFRSIASLVAALDSNGNIKEFDNANTFASNKSGRNSTSHRAIGDFELEPDVKYAVDPRNY